MTTSEWNLSLGDAPPGSFFLGGVPLTDQPANQPVPVQSITASLTWGGSVPVVHDTVLGQVDGDAAPDIATLEVYPFLPDLPLIGSESFCYPMNNLGPEQYSGLSMTSALVLHLSLGANQFLNPHTYTTNIQIAETSYNFPPGYQAIFDSGFGACHPYLDYFYNGEPFQEFGQEMAFYAVDQEPLGALVPLSAASADWYAKYNGNFVLQDPNQAQLDPCSFRSVQDDKGKIIDDGPMDFYQVWLWDTRSEPSAEYVGPVEPTLSGTPLPSLPELGQNGLFDISFCAISDSVTDPYVITTSQYLDFVTGSLGPDSSDSKDIGYSGPQPLTVSVSNMTVSGVSASTGTVDYFKYDPDPSSPNHRPSVTCSVSDSDVGGQYTYLCWLMIQPTCNSGLEFLSLDDVYANVYSWVTQSIPSPTGVNLNWNGCVAGIDPNGERVYSAPDTAGWGTYTYDVIVQKIDPTFQNYVVDQVSFKYPYSLTIANATHNVWYNPSDLSQSGDDELRCNYMLEDYYSGYPNYINPTGVKMIAVDDSLNEQGSVQGGGTVNQFYNGDNNDGILANSQAPVCAFLDWRVLFTCENQEAKLFRRDHTTSRMLAVNQVIPSFGRAAVFLGEVSSLTTDKDIMWQCTYLASFAQNIFNRAGYKCSWSRDVYQSGTQDVINRELTTVNNANCPKYAAFSFIGHAEETTSCDEIYSQDKGTDGGYLPLSHSDFVNWINARHQTPFDAVIMFACFTGASDSMIPKDIKNKYFDAPKWKFVPGLFDLILLAPAIDPMTKDIIPSFKFDYLADQDAGGIDIANGHPLPRYLIAPPGHIF